MPGKDGQRLILAWCNWKKHVACTFYHPENNNVTCDCDCHTKAVVS